MNREDEKRLSRLLRKDPTAFITELSCCVKNSTSDVISKFLSILEKKQSSQSLNGIKTYRENDDENILHIAVKCIADDELIRRIIELCPDLLSQCREMSKDYKGQTPLHIAITMKNIKLVEALFELKNENAEMKLPMITTVATGSLFTNTVMMGQLPLHVAALTFNRNIVDCLLENGGRIEDTNNYGDTVLHSLVKYSAIYPNQTDNVIVMLEHLHGILKNNNDQLTYRRNCGPDKYMVETGSIWFEENGERLTPLTLSCKLGAVEIFQFILNLKGVYCFESSHDGLFDVKLYDITEVDSTANQIVANLPTVKGKQTKVNRNVDGVSERNTSGLRLSCECTKQADTESALEMLFDFDFMYSAAFRIVETVPVKHIIIEKWRKIRYIYYIWGFLHLLSTIIMTSTIVIRSDLKSNLTTTLGPVTNTSKTFAYVMTYFNFGFAGVIYGLMFITIFVSKLRKPNWYRYFFHNFGYTIFLLTVATCLVIDFALTMNAGSDGQDNIALAIAIIASWWFSVFFLRGIKLFSFFTEMIRRVIIGDLLRFAVILSFMFFAFTSGMYASFVGKLSSGRESDAYIEAVESSFHNFGGAMITMFKLMLGLGDIEVLNQARLPTLAMLFYVIFVIITYVLLINSLIAMMSQTCAVVLEDRYPQWRLQQLSVILFLEDILCFICIQKLLGSPGKETKTTRLDVRRFHSYTRYFFKIHSLQTVYASEEDREEIKITMRDKALATLRVDLARDPEPHSLLSTNRSFLSSGERQIRVRNQNIVNLPDVNIVQPAEVSPEPKKKYTTRKHILTVQEEEPFSELTRKLSGSEPNLSKRSPVSKKRRVKSDLIQNKNKTGTMQNIESSSNVRQILSSSSKLNANANKSGQKQFDEVNYTDSDV